MSNEIIENDIIMALNEADITSLSEILKSVDASKYRIKDQVLQKRILKITSEKLGVSLGKTRNTIKTMIASAAAIIFLLLGSFLFRNEAKALIEKIFFWIPGVGMVEQPVTVSESGETKFPPMEIITDRGLIGENSDLYIEIKNAYIRDQKLTLEYTATMKKVDCDHITDLLVYAYENGLSDEETSALLSEYLTSLGYQKYFNINTANGCIDYSVKESFASVELMDTTLKKESSFVFTGEASGGMIYDFTDCFDLSDITMPHSQSGLQSGVLKLNDIEIAFSLSKATEYSSMTDVQESINSCERNGVKLACETYFTEDELKIEITVLDTGDLTLVNSVLPFCIADEGQNYPYLMVGDDLISLDTIEPVYDESDTNENGLLGERLVFDLSGFDTDQEMSFHIPYILASVEDEYAVIDIPAKHQGDFLVEKTIKLFGGTIVLHEGFIEPLVDSLYYFDYMDPDYDYVSFDYDAYGFTDDVSFIDFDKVYEDGVESEECMGINLEDRLGMMVGTKSQKLEIKGAYLAFHYDFSFPISKK